MKKRIGELSRIPVAIALTATLGMFYITTPAEVDGAWAGTLAAANGTEDVLYLADGRVLHGNIVEEDRMMIRFEVVDRKLGQTQLLRFFRSDVLHIERNVQIKEPEATAEAQPGNTPLAAKPATNYDPNLPGIYIIPITGQMGTDVRPEVYDKVIADAKRHQPECIVFVIDCDEREYRTPGAEGNTEYLDFEEYRELIRKLQRSFDGDVRQVVWIKDSIGVSSLIALSWKEIYMMPEARLDGLGFIHEKTEGWQDEDVREKMKAAWSGIAKGFLELGNHDLDIGQAMMFPEESLSASFKGLKVIWELDQNGEVVVDDRDKQTAGFDAENARNLRISQETVDTLGDDDLADMAFILGYREYYKVPGEGENVIETYIEVWRKTFAETEGLFKDVDQFMGWASGDDTVKYMSKSLAALRTVLKAMNRYIAIEKEWERRGITKLRIERQIEELQEQIRGIRKQQKGAGGSGRGRGGGGYGRGGGGGPRPGG